ncbi:hypothetical protein A2U01_0009740, partial [Trifolium medium]|nr:hypothetical protein [Trifolium medium]
DGVIKERDLLLEQVKARNEQITGLEEKLRTVEAIAITEEERKMDPDGAYARFSRVDFVRTVLDWQGSIVEVSSSQFRNVVAQIMLLNPNIELNLSGLDKEKEVRDGQIASPPDSGN